MDGRLEEQRLHDNSLIILHVCMGQQRIFLISLGSDEPRAFALFLTTRWAGQLRQHLIGGRCRDRHARYRTSRMALHVFWPIGVTAGRGGTVRGRLGSSQSHSRYLRAQQAD